MDTEYNCIHEILCASQTAMSPSTSANTLAACLYVSVFVVMAGRKAYR